jgi:site-specific recombinase XerD
VFCLDILIKKYLQDKKSIRAVRPTTYEFYQKQLTYFHRYIISRGLIDVQDVSKQEIVRYLRGKSVIRKGVVLRQKSLHTINNTRNALFNFFRYLHQNGYINDNPIKYIPSPNLPKTIPKILSVQEARMLLEHCIAEKGLPQKIQLRNCIFIALILFYGLREKEILHLKVKDINFQDQTIRISQNPRNDMRVLSLFPPLSMWLKEYMRLRSKKWRHYVFQSYFEGDKCICGLLRHVMSSTSERYQIKITATTLRNTFISLMLNVGVEHRVLQAIMGGHTLSAIRNKNILETKQKTKTILLMEY